MFILGIEFAPLFIPFKRRLQTLTVALHFFMTLIVPLICLLISIYLLFTRLWPLIFAYFIYIYVIGWKLSKMGGYRSEWLRRSRIWHYFRDYFPISLVKTAELDTNRNYIFGYHPHGILACSAICNFVTEATGFSKIFPGIKVTVLTLVSNFFYPFYREYLILMGVRDVSKESIQNLLTQEGKGNAVVIVIGGAEEALEARPHIYRLAIKHRKGFIKMAITTGSDLVPCFGFNENDIFNQVSNPKGSKLRKFQELFKNLFHFSPPLYYGRGIFNYSFGLMPHRKPLVTVVGEPIQVKQTDNPSEEMVNKIHEEYLNNLQILFEENKLKYGLSSKHKLILY